MSLLLAQSAGVVAVQDLVGRATGIAEVWGVVVDANDPASGVFEATAVRLVYHVEPPNRFWPRKSLKPY